MASYSVAAGKLGKRTKTTAADVMDTVTFADNWQQVEIISDGAGALYVTVDGPNATVAGDETEVLPAGVVSVRTIRSPAETATVVKLISDAAVTYSVTGQQVTR